MELYICRIFATFTSPDGSTPAIRSDNKNAEPVVSGASRKAFVMVES